MSSLKVPGREGRDRSDKRLILVGRGVGKLIVTAKRMQLPRKSSQNLMKRQQHFHVGSYHNLDLSPQPPAVQDHLHRRPTRSGCYFFVLGRIPPHKACGSIYIITDILYIRSIQQMVPNMILLTTQFGILYIATYAVEVMQLYLHLRRVVHFHVYVAYLEGHRC